MNWNFSLFFTFSDDSRGENNAAALKRKQRFERFNQPLSQRNTGRFTRLQAELIKKENKPKGKKKKVVKKSEAQPANLIKTKQVNPVEVDAPAEAEIKPEIIVEKAKNVKKVKAPAKTVERVPVVTNRPRRSVGNYLATSQIEDETENNLATSQHENNLAIPQNKINLVTSQIDSNLATSQNTTNLATLQTESNLPTSNTENDLPTTIIESKLPTTPIENNLPTIFESNLPTPKNEKSNLATPQKEISLATPQNELEDEMKPSNDKTGQELSTNQVEPEVKNETEIATKAEVAEIVVQVAPPTDNARDIAAVKELMNEMLDRVEKAVAVISKAEELNLSMDDAKNQLTGVSPFSCSRKRKRKSDAPTR